MTPDRRICRRYPSNDAALAMPTHLTTRSNNCPATVAAMPGVCLRAISEHAPRMVSGFALSALLALQGCTGAGPRSAAEVPRPVRATARTASLTSGPATVPAAARRGASDGAATTGPVSELIQQAEHEYREGRLDAAENLLEEVRQKQPGDERAYRLRARIALDRGDRGAHRLAGDRFLAAHRDSAAAWHLVGRDALEAGDVRSAVRLLERAAELNPAEPRYALDFASACVAAEEPERAEPALRRAQERSPRNPSLAVALARYYESCGRWEEAVQHYRRALSTAPQNLQWHRQLARCLYRQGNFDASRREFQLCVQHQVQLSLSESIEFGDACLQAGQFAHAQRIFDEIARASSHRVKEVELLRSTCAIRQGNWQRARGILTSAQAQWPDDGSIDELLARCVPDASPAKSHGSTIQLAGHEEAVEANLSSRSDAVVEKKTTSEWRPTSRKSTKTRQTTPAEQPVIVAAGARSAESTAKMRADSESAAQGTPIAAPDGLPRVTPGGQSPVKPQDAQQAAEWKSAGETSPALLPIAANNEAGTARPVPLRAPMPARER